MTLPVVSLRSVVALAGRYPVLAGADLEVSSGEIVAVTGPNGAGKTSLLRVIAGLIEIHEGQATVLGHDLRRNRREHRERIGLVGHNAFLYDELTVRENLDFFAGKNSTEALAMVGLAERSGLVAGLLSSGQRRRLGLAILLARKPELWLLDEPYAGLDAASRDILTETLEQIASNGATILFSAHDMHAVADLASRTVVVDGGLVVDGRLVTRAEVPVGVA